MNSGDGKRLCDVKNCSKPLSNKQFKVARDLQRSYDQSYADGKYWTKEKPFEPFKWATCAGCKGNALAGVDDGFIVYRDGHKVKVKGNIRQRRAAATRLAKEASSEPEPEPEQQTGQTSQGAADNR